MKIRRIVTNTALVLALSGVVQAAELFTPSLEPAEGNRLDCRILNVTGQNQTVRTRVVGNDGGTPLVDTGDFILGAGATAVANIAESDTLHPRHCHFTVVGAKSKFRGSACVFQDGVGCTAAVPAQ